jgi:hypothetical protein
MKLKLSLIIIDIRSQDEHVQLQVDKKVGMLLSFIAVPVLSQKSDWSSICVLQVTLLLLSLSTIAVPVLSQESD